MSKNISNISASTAIDLKAQIAKQKEEFEKLRSSTGKQSAAKKSEKKPTVWTRQNKGVEARNAKDKRIEAVEVSVLTRSREQLEKKAKIYEAMRQGKYPRNDDDDLDEDKAPLIDFDKKYFQELEYSKTHEEKRKKRRVEKEEEEDDPWVEYEDEFGRTRVVRRSEVPVRSPSPESEEEFYMPRPSYEREDGGPDGSTLNHYDVTREIRTTGVGFYRFSTDDEERQAQFEKLQQLRQETENARKTAKSASAKRKEMMAKNADRINARKAALKAKMHQLKPEEIPQNVNISVNEDTVTSFLQSMRKQVE
ncbi:hypothetical protein BDB01DRAFT_846343 [Pilobolus umbonatus]|nr:hypothetical protein BDB01DRAFT_846343 [Pilobolus umbonatus]